MTNAHDCSILSARQLMALILLVLILTGLVPARGETLSEKPLYPFQELDTPDDVIPVISSAGKKNLKINGAKSKGKLIRYTIPEQLLKADSDFLSLMLEAEKYIGYPYVYGGSKPSTSFDCSGFVCWVFSKSGVYKTGRLGAKGLYGICKDISRDQARPGDLVFFEGTMGTDVKGITHVGIYVGNNMMIHAGDPIGFADLKSTKWAKKLYGFGRLPIQ